MPAKPFRWPCFLGVLAAAWTSGICAYAIARADTAEQGNRSLTIKNGSDATVAVTSEVWDKLPRTSVKVPAQEGETT
jgi:hypothetical protein